MPFLNEENQTDETKEILEKYFWLKILRAGGMDVESAWKVMINYINLLNNNPAYFTKAHPPAKLDLTYQQQVITSYNYVHLLCHLQLQGVSFQIHNVLEHRDQHGRRIYIFRPGHWDPDKISLQDMFCGGYAMSEMIAMETKYAIMR